MLRKVSEAIKKSPLEFVAVFLILSLAFFLRVYRIDQTLGFYYDQGRDALVIWDLLHNGKFFLIGPTTGIEGVFRGPFYYYLITPFYWLGNGNPVWPSVFLSLTTVFASFLLYLLGRKVGGFIAGFLTLLLSSFSYQIFYASRWLSNPTPMLLLSVIFVWTLYEIWKGKTRWWPVAVFVAGLSLFHFGSAGELYYFLAMLVVFLAKKKILGVKIIVVSAVLLVFTALPQMIFDFRHQQILSKNFTRSFVTGQSFAFPTKQFMKDKLVFYHDVSTYKIFPQRSHTQAFFLIAMAVLFIYYFRELVQKDLVKVLLIILASPILGLVFFKGNYGNIYDYYLTGYYLPFLLLVAVVVDFLWQQKLLYKLFIIWFGLLFLFTNWGIIRGTMLDSGNDFRSVVHQNQRLAIDWIFQNAGGKDFNVDVYVPPVIPYAYNYLFKWLGNTKYGYVSKEENISLLYLVYEVDSPHPERLEAWMKRQDGIAKSVEIQKFGGITVEKRIRYAK
ncbi:hypothetical protein A2188_03355 [Candidatus Woesebacteria bacterium RIFOXYA1_FULL_43_9]|uniref:Glycosyltransferase RgtA/B/C/D-like domain-containing protein n=1 Tax=Candidatus Woesebacteria bacterium RIFOXYA1_FULL_43_9 TaxID=1802534 RepID=A0A1F8CP13_9BACT|nr:MAG: hypothetical protein A2188_03355 [Candidatus Woesebacteria bacterium RIFOXYA1_FULL_43_9]